MKDSQQQGQLNRVCGTIQKLKLPSAIFGMERRIQLYLPPSYHTQSSQRYPVLYMHFGQHIFAPNRPGDDSWQVHRLIDRLLDANRMEEIIVVGIAAERSTIVADYNHYIPAIPDSILGGEKYESFILHEL